MRSAPGHKVDDFPNARPQAVNLVRRHEHPLLLSHMPNLDSRDRRKPPIGVDRLASRSHGWHLRAPNQAVARFALLTQGAEQIAKTWMVAPAPEAAEPLTVQAV